MGWSGLAGYGLGRCDNGGFCGHGFQSDSSGYGVSHSSVGGNKTEEGILERLPVL